jgi:hypothetical protein
MIDNYLAAIRHIARGEKIAADMKSKPIEFQKRTKTTPSLFFFEVVFNEDKKS